jgi:hypothetical protein
MTDFDLYVQRQAEQQANRPDSADKQPLDFTPFESVLAGISAERSAELTGLIAGASIAQLSEHLAAGVYSSVELTAHFLAAIRAHQHLNAFLEVNPDALELAAAADAERAAGQVRGALHGIPVALMHRMTHDRLDLGQKARCGGLGHPDLFGRQPKPAQRPQFRHQPQMRKLQPAQAIQRVQIGIFHISSGMFWRHFVI